MDRRHFLQAAGLGAVGLLSASRLALATQQQVSAAGLIEGKDERLKVHSQKPVVLETPLRLLDEQSITPKQILFVRNNQQIPGSATIKPVPLAGWKIELTGLLKPAPAIDGDELAKMDQIEHEMVLQCSGNSRSLFSAAAPVKGTSWGRGGVGNVRFAGVPLSAVLRKYDIKVDPQAKFLAAEGRDQPEKVDQPDFEHSIPLEEAMKKSFLVLRLNGEALPAVHGGPVRLATPGYYGTMHIKWLSRLRFEKTETTNHYQLPQYRMPLTPIKPGEIYEFTFENSTPTWRMRVTSFILHPDPGATLQAGALTFSGIAFNDGAARLEAVLVSFDRGQSWERAEFQAPASPYAWYPWKAKTVLKPGSYPVWARAVDTLGRSQPLDGTIYWNPNGYEWHGVDKIEVTVK